MPHKQPRSPWPLTLGLAAASSGLTAIFWAIGRQQNLDEHVPEFTGLALLAGILYLAAVYLTERVPTSRPNILVVSITLVTAVAIRVCLLPAPPALSDDLYRYQWEGSIERAHLNPYDVFPALPGLEKYQAPGHPIRTGSTVRSLYPPLTEWSFSWVRSAAGYKRMYTTFDLASVGVILLLLRLRRQPLERVLIYAWNPTVVLAFALGGHHDSLAILTLLTANLFIITRREALGMAFLGLSVLSKLFPLLWLPAFWKRTQPKYRGFFLVTVLLGYLPYARAGRNLFRGLFNFASGWEANDSLFRLLLAAGNSKAQAGLIAAVLLLLLVVFTLQKDLEPLRAGLVLSGGLLLLSPDAFPWYFTWLIAFLPFHSSAPWLLMSVTGVLGYAPVAAYAAGQPYVHSPLILALEYVPVCLWLAVDAWRASPRESDQADPTGTSRR